MFGNCRRTFQLIEGKGTREFNRVGCIEVDESTVLVDEAVPVRAAALLVDVGVSLRAVYGLRLVDVERLLGIVFAGVDVVSKCKRVACAATVRELELSTFDDVRQVKGSLSNRESLSNFAVATD